MGQEQFKNMICCVLLAMIGGDIFRTGVFLVLADFGSAIGAVAPILVNGLIIHILFRKEAKFIMQRVKENHEKRKKRARKMKIK